MEDIVGQKFLSNYSMMNKIEVTVRVDAISSICWKLQLSQ